MNGKNQSKSSKKPLSSTKKRDESEQVGMRHDNQGWHHGPSMRKKRTTKRREAMAKKGIQRNILHKESHKAEENNTNKEAKDMHLATDDKPIKTT